MFAQLYTAPAAMLDMCDSNGCLPGQIPMAGQKAHSNLDANATTTMDQVSATPRFILSGQLCRRWSLLGMCSLLTRLGIRRAAASQQRDLLLADLNQGV